MDNIFVERLWRSYKYEDVYLKLYTSGKELFDGTRQWFDFYNNRRPHQALGYQTPAQVFYNTSGVQRGEAPLNSFVTS